MSLRFVSIVAALVLAGCIVAPPDDRIGPKPPTVDESLEGVSRESLKDYGRRLADSFDAVAVDLDSGAIGTAEEANAKLKERNVESRKQAFLPVDREFNRRFGGDSWSPAEASKAFREAARGLRK
jgi:hypothetical protein